MCCLGEYAWEGDPCCVLPCRLQFVLVMAGDVIVASAPAFLCDGESHVINVTVAGNLTWLEVDGQSGRSEQGQEPVDLQLP